jgi:uncharacterized protein YjbJ (UPF0337 family)
MAGDILTGKWNQMKGDLKKHWGKLTDDDITYINGDVQKLHGKLQERYGWDKMRAETEYNTFLKNYETTTPVR